MIHFAPTHTSVSATNPSTLASVCCMDGPLVLQMLLVSVHCMTVNILNGAIN